MLLLMVQAKFDQREKLRIMIPTEQRADGIVDEDAIAAHLIHRWSRDQTPLWPRMHRPHGLIVRIEQVVPIGLVRAECGIAAENELFEKPARMGQMPFPGAGVRHRLQQQVFRTERLTQARRPIPNVLKTRNHLGGSRRLPGSRHIRPCSMRDRAIVKGVIMSAS
jgi:hypothetical protein